MRVREALLHPTYRACLASGFANGWCNFGVRVAILPQFAVAVHDDTWVAGIALAVAALGTALTLQVAGRLADRSGRRPLVIVGLLVTAASLGLIGLSGDLLVLLLLSAVSGVGAGLVNPGQQAAVADVGTAERSGGTVLSTFQMSQDFGAILGPVLSEDNSFSIQMVERLIKPAQVVGRMARFDVVPDMIAQSDMGFVVSLFSTMSLSGTQLPFYQDKALPWQSATDGAPHPEE